MKRLIVTALSFGVIYSADAGAEGFITGEDLHEICRGPGDGCTAYIMGVMDAVDRMESTPGVSATYCFPEVTSDQATAVVTKFLKRHPAKWHTPAASMVVTSLAEAFPCGRKGG